MRRLIVNADDFGLTQGINSAIQLAFESGSVTSTTLMVNASASAEAIGIAKRHPTLGTGLHFNLTLGAPISKVDAVASLVNRDGYFVDRKALALRLLRRAIDPRHILSELKAQHRVMLEHGLTPSHIDSHQHVHALPLLFDVLAEYCSERRIPIRVPWVLDLPDTHSGLGRRVRRFALRWQMQRHYRLWGGRLVCNDGLGSIFDLNPNKSRYTDEDYRRILSAAPAGAFELMVHPARDVQTLQGLTSISEVSAKEFEYLSTERLRVLAKDLGFVLNTYRDI
ncbi:MAG: ChbG/HpnK family deacetylase [Pseudomonadota bacterium]